ncbi:Uu.00g075680.m01.CDS01 [Anthostomella pinea]|uniref:Uu.00g075680.m01.CDS01 n=1 Tax=Anthostomella pinea TaxID=933095 RepID=A0AAI8YP49_9PEZI|nr:Uu.00g075680.m01.CDS01 [Anthostomella pinea]
MAFLQTKSNTRFTVSQATASNERIAAALPEGLVAVFVGGTSGVGEYTVKAFAKYAPSPRVYIIGRSQEAADPIIQECQQLNSGGQFEFIQADVSLLNTIDDVCRQIRSRETAINIPFQSQGTMGFDKKTAEGLPLAFGIATHGRMRFILNLLPLLQKAKSLRRVVNVGAASYEGAIDVDNVPGLGFPLTKWRNQLASVQTLLLEEAARRAPDVAFVLTCPGVVKSGIMRDIAPSLGMSIMLAVTKLMAPLIETSPDECAERHVFFATSARYPASQNGPGAAGVALDGSMAVARGSDGRDGSGVYTTDQKGASSSPKVESVLAKFRKDGTAGKVWDFVVADFVRITGAEVAP